MEFTPEVSVAHVNVHFNGFEIADRVIVCIRKYFSSNGICIFRVEVYTRDRKLDETSPPVLIIPLKFIRGVKKRYVIDETDPNFMKGEITLRGSGSPDVIITMGWASASYFIKQFHQI
jgi:hypothetical protein